MAAQYTEITLEDMDRFFKRAYRALRPRRDLDRGEYVYTLKLSKNVGIRVYSSITKEGTGAGVGSDAIRVVLYGTRVRRPLVKGKAPIVKRTQGWRNSLQKQIEQAIETYDEKESYWEERAGGPSPEERAESRQKEGKPTLRIEPRLKVKPLIISILEEVGGPDDVISMFTDNENVNTVVVLAKESASPSLLAQDLSKAFFAKGIKPTQTRGKVVLLNYDDVAGSDTAPAPKLPPTDKQIRFALKLLKKVSDDNWYDHSWNQKYKIPTVPDEEQLRGMERRQVSALIDDLLKNGFGYYRNASTLDLEYPEYDQLM